MPAERSAGEKDVPEKAEDAKSLEKEKEEADAKRREQFADFFTDAAFGGCVVGIAHLANYGQPSLFLFGHILSLLMLALFASSADAQVETKKPRENKKLGEKLVGFCCAFGIAALVQLDVNFFLHVVCALDPDGCCGEFVSREPTAAPACSGSVPRVSVLGGVTLLVGAMLLILWGLRRWVDFIKEYPPGAISLALVVKVWQISFVGEWRDQVTVFSVAVLLLSFLQLLFSVIDFCFQCKVLSSTAQAEERKASNFNSRVAGIAGMCASYVSATVQLLLLDGKFQSVLYGNETVAPLVNLIFTTVVFFVFLTRASYNAEDSEKPSQGEKYHAKWFARTGQFARVLCPACIFTAVLLFFCTLVLLESSSFFAATTFSAVAYIIMLPLRLAVYTAKDAPAVWTYLATFFLADAAFLGIVISRRRDERAGAFFCIAGALLCSILHTVACFVLYLRDRPETGEIDTPPHPNGPGPVKPASMFPLKSKMAAFPYADISALKHL